MTSVFGEERVNKTNVWLTPPWVLEKLGEFDTDPCSPIDRPWDTAKQHYTEEDDGLAQVWQGRVWLNPPYGLTIGNWMQRMAEHDGGGIALVFVRTDTKWFFNYVWPYATAMLFMKKRVQFYKDDGSPSKDNASAPSVLVAYSKMDAEILKNSGIEGHYVNL